MVAYFEHHYFLSQIIAMQIKVAISSLIYRKVFYFKIIEIITFSMHFYCLYIPTDQCLKLSPRALGKTTTGQIVNLLANDVIYYEACSMYFSFLWTAPLLVMASIVIMFFYFGIYAFVVIAILVLLIPIQVFNVKLNQTFYI